MWITYVVKRSGTEQEYNSQKITQSLHDLISFNKELKGKYQYEDLEKITKLVEKELYTDFNESDIYPTTQDISTIVEHVLMANNYFDIARSYIVYSDIKNREYQKKKRLDSKKLESNKLKVQKSDWEKVLFDIEKVKKVFNRANVWYKSHCKFQDIEEQFKSYMIDGISTSKITELLIKCCIDSISLENTYWQYVAWRLQLFSLYKKACKNRGLKFSQLYSISSFKKHFYNYLEKGLYYKDFMNYYSDSDLDILWKELVKTRDLDYTYSTVTMINKKYLLNPNKVVHELPQEMYMTVAMFLAINEPEETRIQLVIDIYNACSRQEISLPTPTLMNARTNFTQLSSCFVLNCGDDLREIYHNVENIAQISKLGGGVGIYLWNVRSKGSTIRGIEWAAWWTIPWIKVINDTAIAVNQLWSRNGAVSITLDIWHKDILDFFELQTETWDIRSKSFDVFPAVSIPDLFMKRVESNESWTLFDPYEVNKVFWFRLQDFYWEEFEEKYQYVESNKDMLKLSYQISAKELFKTFMRSTVETWMPYVFFRDTANKFNPNKHSWMVYSSQLCVEIIQNTSSSKYISETIEDNGNVNISYQPGDNVVCNLASINIAKVNKDQDIQRVIPIAIKLLNHVVDLNLYPVKETQLTSQLYRSIGLGFMWLAEYLACNKINYDSPQAVQEVSRLFEKYSYEAINSSMLLSKQYWPYKLFEGSDWSKWILLGKDKNWYNTNSQSKEMSEKWSQLIDDIQQYWLRNAYIMAIAPNTSTAPTVWTTASVLPIYKKYFVESNWVAPIVTVAPNLSHENFWYYKEYTNMNVSDVIDVISEIYKWIDQAISFEWLINPNITKPKDIYDLYFKSWRGGIKTVYYVRSQSLDIKEGCVSCSG